MFEIATPRLLLVTTPLPVLRQRMTHDAFSAPVVTTAGPLEVTFPPEWPGGALVLFPGLIAKHEEDPATLPWSGTLIERASNMAIGQLGCKARPTADGMVEIGYGLNSTHRNQGYATEIVRALVAWLRAQPEVRRITAETLPDNRPSMRVLEKCGFVRTGQRTDPEDGPLVLWEYQNEAQRE